VFIASGMGIRLAPVGVSGGGGAPAAPTVTSISPFVGFRLGSGLSVTITGTNFTGATGVTIGGVACTSVVIVNATTITCVTGTIGSEGQKDVVVTGPGGSGTLTNGYRALQSKAWFATRMGGITGSAPVTAVSDHSGNGWTISNGSTGPAKVTADLNGYDTLSFTDTSSNYLDTAGDFGTNAFAGVTQFLVMRFAITATYSMFTCLGDAGDEIRTVSASPYLSYATSGVDNNSTNPNTYDAAWHVVSGTHAAGGGAVKLYVDGTLRASAVSSGGLVSGKLTLGRRTGTANYYANYKTPEAIFFDRVLTDPERADVESFLAGLYGL